MIGVTHVYDSFTSLPSHPMLATYSGLEYVKKPAIKELPPPRTRVSKTKCKQEIHKEQVKPDGLKLQNAHEVVSYLKAQAKKHHASHINTKKTMKKVYWELEIGDINQSCHHSCNTIKGSRSMHQVRSMLARDPTLIQFRQVSCACMSCANKNSDNECERATLVPSWTLSKLVPNDRLHFRGAILHQN
jgi:hypothetical protein